MMDEAIEEAVRRRARNICEYCQIPAGVHPTPFEIEHVVPKQHGGSTIVSNLAYSCLHCNRHKGPNLSGMDRAAGQPKLVQLFNPRRHKWARHFRWDGPYIVGRTAIGRVTVMVLSMNAPLRIAVRVELLDEGLFFPST